MDRETAGKMRGLIRRCTLKNVKDDGEMQTASVEVADGIWKDDVEMLQPYGFAAVVPEDGAIGIVLSVGGDEGDIVVLPVANPSRRMGGMQPGEVGMYTQHGDRMVLTAGGDLQTAHGGAVTMKAGSTVGIEGAGAVSIKGATGSLD